MDVYTLSFTYPKAESIEGGTTVEAVHALCLQAMANVPCTVNYAPTEDGRSFQWQLSGGYSNVMAARAFILRECPVASRQSIPVPRSEILDLSQPNAPALNAHVRRALDDIASATHAHIAVVNTSTTQQTQAAVERDALCHLVVTGPSDTVSLAQVRLLVMLDGLSGLHVESIDIDCKLHPIIAGRKRLRIQNIQEETVTNIYLPHPLRGMVGGPSAPDPHGKNAIWITGEYFSVQRAKDMLFQAARTKSKVVISRETAIQPRKLDWLLTDRLDELKQIMFDNATYLDIPALGSGMVYVYGDVRQNVQKAIKAVMRLTTQVISAQFYLLPTHFNVLMPSPILTNSSQIAPMLKHLTTSTGGSADIVFRDNVFEFLGAIEDCRRGVAGVSDMAIAKSYHHEIRFALELAQEHREFISGKKNGKINKIMQQTGCKIRFEGIGGEAQPSLSPTTPTGPSASSLPPTPNLMAFSNMTSNVSGNFTITLSAQTLQSALDGLVLLLDEMPAEISFHVPETYHKRIIGVGGRSVQRIMKKWGVFVKFFNSDGINENGDGVSTGYPEDVDGTAGAGGAVVDTMEDNVVARTPAKNSMNLENLKANVLELVNPKDKDFTVETVAIPRRYHRVLMGEKSIFIRDIESKTGSKVRFPDRELASDIVTIYGPESQVHIAATRLLDHVPFESELILPTSPSVPTGNSTQSSPTSNNPSSPDLAQLCATPDFNTFVETIKRDYGVVITAVPLTSDSGPLSHPPSVRFKFRCQKSTSDMVPAVKEALESWLATKGAKLYPSAGNGPVAQSPPIVQASSSEIAALPKPHSQTLPLPLSQQLPLPHIHKRADSFADAFPHFNSKLLSGTGSSDGPSALFNRRIRMATSSPDVKALFNRHSSTHSLHSLHQQTSNQVYNLPEHDEQDDEGFEAPPVPESPGEYPIHRIRHAPSVSFIPRMMTTFDTYSDSSDSRADQPLSITPSPLQVGPDGKARSLTNRAQSLDLTSLNRRGLMPMRSRESVRIPSPVDSSPPQSAAAVVHSFPSVYGPSSASNGNAANGQQYHHSYSNSASLAYNQTPYPYQQHQHHYSYAGPGTRPRMAQMSSLSLSSSRSSLSLREENEVDDVSQVLSHINLDGLR